VNILQHELVHWKFFELVVCWFRWVGSSQRHHAMSLNLESYRFKFPQHHTRLNCTSDDLLLLLTEG